MSQETNNAALRIAIRRLELHRRDLKIAMFRIPDQIVEVEDEIARLQQILNPENNANNELTNEEE